MATSFYYVPAEIAEEKVTILIVDCGVQRFLLKTSSSLVDSPYLGKTELDLASASSYENLKMLFMRTFRDFFVGLCCDNNYML